MADSPYNEHGYFRDGLREASQRKYLADQPEGSYQVRGALPPGVLVVERFLAPEQCRAIVGHASTAQARAATVQSGSATEHGRRLSHTRVTDYIPAGPLLGTLTELMREVFTNLVARHFGATIAWFEQPEILRYRAGGHYDPHVDAENWDRESGRWVRGVDRHLSLLLYLNADFTGGELEFQNFGLRLKPKPGMLVVFPSDHRYVHAARPTESGERYVLVCWAAVAGAEYVGDGPPRGATVLDVPGSG